MASAGPGGMAGAGRFPFFPCTGVESLLWGFWSEVGAWFLAACLAAGPCCKSPRTGVSLGGCGTAAVLPATFLFLSADVVGHLDSIFSYLTAGSCIKFLEKWQLCPATSCAE